MTIRAHYFAARRWTRSEEDSLRSLAAAGQSARSIAIQLERSFLSVQSRANKLKIVLSRRSSRADHQSLAAGFIVRLPNRDDGPTLKAKGE
jgi:hypothetical protein